MAAGVGAQLVKIGQGLRPEAVPLALALGAWVGALGYFLSPYSPPLVWGLFLVGFALLALAYLPGLWRAGGWGLVALGALWVLSGWEVQRQQQQAFPWEAAATRSHWLVGQVIAVRPQVENPKRLTLELSPYRVFGLNPTTAAPITLRVGAWANQAEGVTVGSLVAAPVRFIPPSAPLVPGVRDSRMWQWFGAARASAYVTGQLAVTVDGARHLVHERKPADEFLAWMQGVRARLTSFTQGLGQGVVTALLVGEQAGIKPDIREAYRVTGLSHLLAISGMQMTLVALGLFGLLRGLGACWPRLALHYNLKAWAALGALLGMLGYTLLVGASPAVVRAACMVALVLLAVLLGRVRGVMRAWALASVLILAIQPHWAMSAGLQLSAVATLGLGLLASQLPTPQGIWGWAKATLLATVVAGAATAPIVALHFGAPAGLGVLANLVAIPLMTAASYAGFAALVLWPLGLAPVALAPMSWLVELTSAWALWLAGWQSSSLVPLPAVGVWLMCLVAMFTIGLALVQRWSALAALTVLSSVGLWGWGQLASAPEIVVAEGGSAAWVRAEEGGTYRLAWAESPSRAAWLARVAKLPVSTTTETPPCCIDEHLMPVVPQDFAYAYRMVGDWQVAPLRCRRPWERIAEACWGAPLAEEENP